MCCTVKVGFRGAYSEHFTDDECTVVANVEQASSMVSPTEARDSPRGGQLRRLRVDFKARDIPRGGRGNLKANPVWST